MWQPQGHHRPMPMAPSMSSPTYYAGQNPSKVPECDEECAEEECNPDACGDEHRPPKDDNHTCGVDTRPLLPLGLTSSALLSAVVMLVVQLPLLSSSIGLAITLYISFGALYMMTIGCMAYCIFCDPGTLRRDQEDVRRAHKTWLYKKPVRRYDHYCRWLCNCIGLLNHREFALMCTGLVTMGLTGAFVDVIVLCLLFQDWDWISAILICFHLAYSTTILVLAGPILKIHIGLISRNELAAEWKRNDYYVTERDGKLIPVNELDDEEFNTKFDSFMYDKRRNVFDKGLVGNCLAFWCIPRWAPDQLGEF